MGDNRSHTAVTTQRMNHVEQECPVALTCGRYTPVKTMEAVKVGSHLELLVLIVAAILLTTGIETFCPFVEREGHIRNNHIKLFQVAVRVKVLRIRQRVAPSDIAASVVDAVDE